MGTEVRDAATVLLLRDEPTSPDHGDTALEVFMVRRHEKSGFVGGHHVFPGGVVDDADRDPAWAGHCQGTFDPLAVAAVRELLEEAAVLLAVEPTTGRQAVLATEDIGALAKSVHSGSRLLLDICRDEQLFIDLEALRLWSHWITPEAEPRRYDTRFFVAVAPPEQEAIHDELELTAGVWGTPASFLAQHAADEIRMILPTVANLRSIENFPDTAALMAAAAAKGPIRPTSPVMVTEPDGSVTILIDGVAVWSAAPPRG
ncbi:MAG: NUDIX hydrolase [Actinobacteria bacterium]|nr:NUDIX hydrolase [Actinomycetota bacterium]